MQTIDDIKQLIDLREYLEPILDGVSRSGKRMIALCPFHSESTPSFTIGERNYYCFGCKARGDIVNWFMHQHKVGTVEAVKLIMAELGQDVQVSDLRFPPKAPVISSIYRARERLDGLRLNAKLQEMYVTELDKSEKAKLYLANREEKIDFSRFGVGYAPIDDSWVRKLSPKWKGVAQSIGVLNSEGRARIRGRITIPLYQYGTSYINGHQGRSIDPDEKRHKYLNPPNSDAFNKSRYLYPAIFQAGKMPKRRCILGEGAFSAMEFSVHDALAFAVLGSHVSQEQARWLEYYFDEIIIAFDGDEAGWLGTWKCVNTFGMAPGSLGIYIVFRDYGGRQAPIFPLHTADAWVRGELVVENTELDLSLLQELIKPLTEANIRDGYPHWNVLSLVVSKDPSGVVKDAWYRMTTDLSDGQVKRANIIGLIKAWREVVRELRKKKKGQGV